MYINPLHFGVNLHVHVHVCTHTKGENYKNVQIHYYEMLLHVHVQCTQMFFQMST